MTDAPFSLCGKFLIAMPGMGDQRFERSVIFICAHSDEGAMGLIINQILTTPTVPDFLKQLEIITEEEKIELPASASAKSLYVGGPVEPGRGFVLHSPEFKSESTLDVGDNICLTATLEILRLIAKGEGPENTLMALGYSGWSAGQLEDEIFANGWLTVEADTDIVFRTNNDSKYERSLKLLGIDLSLLSSEAGHA